MTLPVVMDFTPTHYLSVVKIMAPPKTKKRSKSGGAVLIQKRQKQGGRSTGNGDNNGRKQKAQEEDKEAQKTQEDDSKAKSRDSNEDDNGDDNNDVQMQNIVLPLPLLEARTTATTTNMVIPAMQATDALSVITSTTSSSVNLYVSEMQRKGIIWTDADYKNKITSFCWKALFPKVKFIVDSKQLDFYQDKENKKHGKIAKFVLDALHLELEKIGRFGTSSVILFDLPLTERGLMLEFK